MSVRFELFENIFDFCDDILDLRLVCKDFKDLLNERFQICEKLSFSTLIKLYNEGRKINYFKEYYRRSLIKNKLSSLYLELMNSNFVLFFICNRYENELIFMSCEIKSFYFVITFLYFVSKIKELKNLERETKRIIDKHKLYDISVCIGRLDFKEILENELANTEYKIIYTKNGQDETFVTDKIKMIEINYHQIYLPNEDKLEIYQN